MEPQCRGVTKLILPAIRASVAVRLSKDYNYTQKEIAERLGIVQVAVSKYLNSRYSDKVKSVKEFIEINDLSKFVVKEITDGKNRGEVERDIDKLCNNAQLIELVSKN